MNIEPLILLGNRVRLDPLSEKHIPALCDVGLNADLWRWTPSVVETPDAMRSYVQSALQLQLEGTALPFVIIDRWSETVVGSTRYGSIEKNHRRVEIGWTWIASPWQRTSINTEAKYLMLKHAFEVLGCMRVELKTDSLNAQSRAAILRIGAKEEGVLRNHMLTHSGRVRHTVYYSIVDSEWPTVKAVLEEKLRYPQK